MEQNQQLQNTIVLMQEHIDKLTAQRDTAEQMLRNAYTALDEKDLEIADLCGKLLAAREAVKFLQPAQAEAKP